MSERGEGTRRDDGHRLSGNPVLGLQGEPFEGSCFVNHGFWEEETRGARQACENLVEKLLALAPGRSGTILDVACGAGATTGHLLTHYPAERVTAIDGSEKNLETARAGAPGVTFRRMDTTALEFPEGTFDTVICVEAVTHLESRDRFLLEARRILKPGGRLLLADILCERWADSFNGAPRQGSQVRDPGEYEALLVRAGFERPQVVDATEESWVRSNRQMTRYLCDLYGRGRIDRAAYNRSMTRRLVGTLSTRYYVLASAAKPVQVEVRETAGAGEIAPPGSEWLGPAAAPPNGLKILLERARLAGAERDMRLRRMARLEEAWARLLRRDGDRRGALRHARRARLYLEASRPMGGGRS